MAENRKQATQKGKVIKDAVNVFLSGGKVYEGWESISITKNMQSIANEFSFQIHDRFEALNQSWPIKPGVGVRVNIGDERVITGFIEKMTPQYAPGSRSITLQGRSRAGDLVDCTPDGATEYKDVSLVELANQLVKPFGLRVYSSVVDKKITKFGIKPGETVFEALNRAARLQGFFWVSTRHGNIRLTRAAKARSHTNLVQDVNVISASLSLDTSERHSIYKVIGQTQGLPNFNGTSASEPEGSAQDAGITRHRPLTIVAEGNIDGDAAKTRAQWEASSRIAKANELSVTVQGWRQENGSLWGVNQLTRVKIPFVGINSDMLISRVVHNQDRSGGTTTDMTLVPKDSFDTKPVIKKEDDLLDKLGPAE